MNDCVNLKNNKCRALNEGTCENCKFYKNEEQMLEERDKVFKRLRKLPIMQQQIIADTYYNRKMVWR